MTLVMLKGCNRFIIDVAEEFVLNEIDVPFKIVLENCVSVKRDRFSGEIASYEVPDFDQLLRAIALARVFHPRRLLDKELKFLRKVAILKQKEIARKINVSPEHLSRCESPDNANILSSAAEKLFRLYAVQGVLKSEKDQFASLADEQTDLLDKLLDQLVEAAYVDSDPQITFRFFRREVAIDLHNQDQYMRFKYESAA